jgi:hypothetical protein
MSLATPSNRTGRPSASRAIAVLSSSQRTSPVLDGNGAFFDQFGKHFGNPWPVIEGAGRSAIDQR